MLSPSHDIHKHNLMLHSMTSAGNMHMIQKISCARRFLHSWVVALQLALVCFTVVALLGLLPLLYFLGHWYLVQQSPLEAWESPQRSLSRRWSSFGRDSPACRTPDAKGQQGNERIWSDSGNVPDEVATPLETETAEEDSQCQDGELQRQAPADGDGQRGWLGACQVTSHCTELVCVPIIRLICPLSRVQIPCCGSDVGGFWMYNVGHTLPADHRIFHHRQASVHAC